MCQPIAAPKPFVALRGPHQQCPLAHVPFFWRTGKRMQKRQSEIIIEFTDQPFSVFGHSAHHVPNRLIIRLQPEESIQLEMMVKQPGSGMNLSPVKLWSGFAVVLRYSPC
jgi:glucose-6-phosphate 1-dehydrogenase